MSNLAWKWILIAVVVAAAVWFVYPPKDTINLGLDLRGGVHVLMQVDIDSAIEYERDLVQSRIGQELKREGIPYESISKVDLDTFELRGTPPAQRSQVREILDRHVTGWDLSEPAAGVWRGGITAPVRSVIKESAVEATLNTLRNRVDQLGVREPLIQLQGLAGDRILVQLPGVEDISEVQDILDTAALLEWKEMTYPPDVDPQTWRPGPDRADILRHFGGALPADTEIYEQVVTDENGTEVRIAWPLKKVSTIIGNDIRMARRSADEWGEPAISFELTQDAAKRFSTATQENIGRVMAIVLDKQVISAPTIQSQIFDQGIINGAFSVESAEKLALQLRSGALPTEIRVIEERTVGPSLGLDSIKAGILASVIGFLGITIAMLIYYRMSGINAILALALNVLIVLGAMAYFGATLTLPGIAGLVLVIGMAVDSNVLIFERIREELRLGKTVRSAVDQGFRMAFGTILDCNVTTLVSAFFLFSYGTGPVRGFAVSLFIGLVASMFTAVFVSRRIFELVLGRGAQAETLSI